tara:strand:+ start:102 stop:500 length:399 start_codon:yes stop_codon:yes gene_type:complete
LIAELYFIGLVIVISVLGRIHLSTYWKSTPRFASTPDLDRYQSFVTVQMWLSLALILGFVPALAAGVFFALHTDGLIAYAPTILFVIPYLIGRGGKRLKKTLRENMTIPDPELKERHGYISLVWTERTFPRF